MNLNLRAVAASVVGLVATVALLFWPAGTFAYWQGWALIAVMVALSTPYTVYLATRHPQVLERRLRVGPAAETRTIQRLAVFGLQASVLAAMVLSAFDHRFGWSHVPVWLCVVGLGLTAVGLGASMLVVLQNSWAAGTIEIQTGQELVARGLYGIVRHPMYSGATLMLVGIPLGLGSFWGLLPGLLGVVALIVRTVDEEKLLVQDLPGYPDYRARVRYRMVPYLW
ncbi:isoprenylcysteine carboxylmethyltransferase family protein [Mycolicibacterium sp.]|uniref:methyltransferase family protein n=1 Tax=Mycolicibacterium sp. TaxID=2320850 RepID=UPI00355FBF49